MDNNLFKNIEKKTGVNMKDVMELASSVQNANFSDETVVRNLVKRVAKVANKNVPTEMEDKIVSSIMKNGKQLDFNTIANMMGKKK